MIPGEIRVKKTDIEINPNSPETVIEVKNVGDRPNIKFASLLRTLFRERRDYFALYTT